MARRSFVLGLCLAACGDSSDFGPFGGVDSATTAPSDGSSSSWDATSGDGTGAESSSGSTAGSDTGVDTDSLKLDVGDDAPTPTCECTSSADRIYLLSAADPADVLGSPAEIWAFFPGSLSFEKVASTAACGPFLPFSMSVDRIGFAWILGIGGAPVMVKLDLSDPSSCTGVPFDHNGPFAFSGMGFAANGPSDACDRLYLHADPTHGPHPPALGVMDPVTADITSIGGTMHERVELTGTGDGRLYGFELVNPPSIVHLDKASAQDLSTLALPLQVDSGGAFAFAFFEGDFYVFVSPAVEEAPSRVLRVDYDSSDGPGQAVTTVVEQAPIQVVGAGVSTCVSPVPEG